MSNSRKTKIRSDSYIVIQGWMVTELHLKQPALMIYAIIYGFSQTEGQAYYNGLQYLMEWTGKSENTVRAQLKEMIKKGIILKESKAGSADRLIAVRPLKNCTSTPSVFEPTPYNISDYIYDYNLSE